MNRLRRRHRNESSFSLFTNFVNDLRLLRMFTSYSVTPEFCVEYAEDPTVAFS
jgi:hypothetical protein